MRRFFSEDKIEIWTAFETGYTLYRPVIAYTSFWGLVKHHDSIVYRGPEIRYEFRYYKRSEVAGLVPSTGFSTKDLALEKALEFIEWELNTGQQDKKKPIKVSEHKIKSNGL